ncbi:MAG: TonB-dependent receptor plug domain-containing protein, partial [Muribaculaceae bacterium]|nr:TonB-dependent receptor plug domain-containing protein [Muribaculaceae bacterium]
MKKYIVMICSAGMMAMPLTARAQEKTSLADSIAIDLGFGVVQNLTTTSAAISVISGDDLRASGAINLSDALYGRLLGLTALKNGGFEGDDNYGASFNIRGNQTLSENGILVLVDGFRRPIDRITVEEVESVAVLKDAAAVAMLGYEGVNGALLVTTKHGNQGGPYIDVSYRHEFLFDPKMPDFVNGHDYASALNTARINDGLAPAYSDLEMELYRYGSDRYLYPNVNWQNEVFKNSASEDQVNLSISGGSDKMRYFTFLDYTDSRGALRGTDQTDYNSQLRYSKANIRANLDFKVTPTTDMTVNMSANFIETAYPASGMANDITARVYGLPSNAFPVMNPDGMWGGNTTFTDANPVARVQSTGREKTHQRALYADARLTQRFDFLLPGLSASLRVGYDNLSQINERHGKSFQYGYLSYGGAVGDPTGIVSTVYGDKVNNLEFSKWLGNQWRSSNFAFTVNYEQTFNTDHYVSAVFVYNTNATVNMNRYNTFNRANVMGYLNYAWRKRFNATVVLAGNGSNRSYPHKWSFSPTFSAAYLIADNPDSKILNLAKIRASAGIQHSDYVPVNGIWLENYEGSHGNIVFRPNYDGNFWGGYLSHYPLSDFDLETAYKYNLGADLRLFRGLSLTADAYYYRRSNIMMSANDLNSWVVG